MYAAPPAPFVFAALLVGLLALNIAFLGFLIQVNRDHVMLVKVARLRLAHIPLFSAAGYLLLLLFHVMFLAMRETVAPGEDFDSATATVELLCTSALLASLFVALVWLVAAGITPSRISENSAERKRKAQKTASSVPKPGVSKK